MDRFGLYAQYYDLLYKDKDYTGEAGYVDGLLKKHDPKVNKLLNLGCGTGKHDYALARLGYNVTGVDLSETMVNQAQNNIPKSIANQLDFIQSDIRSLQLNARFDAVISLFHVMSYQVTNEDLAKAIDTAYNHLQQGGLFVFDCWYGPAVLTDPPVVRIKRMRNDAIEVTRLAEPLFHSIENTIDVNYTILVKPFDSNVVTEIKETHKMRYLFVKEIELMIKNKFSMLVVNEWLSDKQPALNSWNAVFILKKL